MENKSSTIGILDLPDLPLDNVFKQLDWNDLLRLRRVSRHSKNIVEDFMIRFPERAPEIEINETDKRLENYLELGFYTTKIYLNLDSVVDYFKKDVNKLFELSEALGTNTRELRISQMTTEMLRNEDLSPEWRLIELLVGAGLQVLNCTSLVKSPVSTCLRFKFWETNRDVEFSIVSTIHLKGLKSLSLGKADNCQTYAMSLICFASKNNNQLQKITLPYDNTVSPFINVQASLYYLKNALDCSTGNKDTVVDFKNLYQFDQTAESTKKMEQDIAATFPLTVATFGAKVANVNAAWFQRFHWLLGMEMIEGSSVGHYVISLVNFFPSVCNLELPNLESWIINSSRSVIEILGHDGWKQSRPEMPFVNYIDITIDSKFTDAASEWLDFGLTEKYYPSIPSVYLFKFVFEDVLYANLSELSITWKPLAQTCFPKKVDDIVASVPNITKLTICNWNGKNKEILKFWKALVHLKEVQLDSCPTLSNGAFVGTEKDLKSPVFLGLNYLKKLTLKGLDVMPKITNNLFRLVLRHMPLSHLMLSSNEPVTMITVGGIQELLTGRFSETIERFPFVGWSLANCSAEDFLNLQQQFRSFNML